MENGYIVTTSNDTDAHGLETLEWADLQAANFSFNKPFCLRLADGQFILFNEVVRVLPKKRMVAFGTWQGKQIAAKLFFDLKSAKRNAEKDVTGIKSLQKNKIPTPELLYEGKSLDQCVYVLIFERILDAANLGDVWQNRISMEDVLPALQSVIIEIATQHVLGLLQHDLHLRNFLLTEKTIYTLDGAQIELFPFLLSKKISINNLALFLSQLGINMESYQEQLFKYYAQARGWSLKPEDTVELFRLIKKWNDIRWNKFEKKAYRDSSDFVSVNTWTSVGMVNRHFEGEEFSKLIADPESAFTQRSTKILKSGRSSTVVKVTLDQHDYVVKRYNMKNIWHRLRRCLRPTRASSCWRLAQKLYLFNVPTAMPVAFIEQRILCIRGKSYYITQYVPGEHAGEWFFHHFSKPEKIDMMIKRISLLLKSVAKVEITHGDLKITNILVNDNDEPCLIDLDGAAEHLSLSSLRKEWKKELNRFLQNFDTNPAILKKFEVELEKW